MTPADPAPSPAALAMAATMRAWTEALADMSDWDWTTQVVSEMDAWAAELERLAAIEQTVVEFVTTWDAGDDDPYPALCRLRELAALAARPAGEQDEVET